MLCGKIQHTEIFVEKIGRTSLFEVQQTELFVTRNI